MFTGIIEETGKIKNISSNASGKQFEIQAQRVIEDAHPGDSIAIDGVCLSVTTIGKDVFTVQAVRETLQRTTLDLLRKGDVVNLERAMRADGRFGGHFVQGHVDGVAKLRSKKIQGESALLFFSIPAELKKYIVPKGSIALNGISLTVAAMDSESITVAVIPITLRDTSLGLKKDGDSVNVEVDMLAKYVENFMDRKDEKKTISQGMREWGYRK